MRSIVSSFFFLLIFLYAGSSAANLETSGPIYGWWYNGKAYNDAGPVAALTCDGFGGVSEYDIEHPTSGFNLGVVYFRCTNKYYPGWSPVSSSRYSGQCPIGFAARLWQGANVIGCGKNGEPNDSEQNLNNETCQTSKYPIALVSGTKLQRENDYVGPHRLLSFTRYYRHKSTRETVSRIEEVAFGKTGRWTHTFARAIKKIGNSTLLARLNWPPISSIYLIRPDGREVLFVREVDSNNWVTWDGDHLLLQELSDGGWKLTNEKSDTEHYDAQGKLTRIDTVGGYFVTLSWAGRTLTVEDSYGVSLSLVFDEDLKVTQLIDPNGQTTSYGYDATGSVAEVLYPNGESKKYTYESRTDGFLTSIENERGLIGHSISYADGGNTITETFNEGRGSFSFAPDELFPNSKNRVVDQLGKETIYTYEIINTQKKLVSIDSQASVNCPQAATSYEYADDGQLKAKVDWEGNRTEYVRDTLGRITSKTDGKGSPEERTTTTVWHSQWSKPTQRTEPGRQTDYTYDSSGNIETKTVTDTATSETRTWSFSHSATGQLLTADGPRTDVTDTTTFTYYNCATGGKCGQRHTVTNALGHVTTFNSYDAHGNPLSITDANGVDTVLTYDLRQRLKTSTVAGG